MKATSDGAHLDIDSWTPGQVLEIPDVPCPRCEGTAMVVRGLLEATKLAPVAGVQIKASAREHPWLVCPCGFKSRGRR